MESSKDILDAVKAYIELPDSSHAIMIDGDWGCGKTYLWKNVIHPEIGKSEAIYISMFGLKEVKDIENEIFKSLSFMGEDDDGVLKGILNSNPNIAEDIRFGGLGFAVQFGLKKWKERKLNKSKKLFICFDDIERWAGDIEVCLSYINKLVEHDGAKCLIIGNTKQFDDKNKNKFMLSKEKTIGIKYKLSYPPAKVIEAAINIANFPNENSKQYTQDLLSNNIARLIDFLSSVNFSNIRILSTAIHYFSIIYGRHSKSFDASPANAVYYFVSLLSLLILVEFNKSNDNFREKILDASKDDVFNLQEILGLSKRDDSGQSIDLTPEEKIVEYLVNHAFYLPNEVKIEGRSSIVAYGFYREQDFENEFSEWNATREYECYLDTFKYWYLDDDTARQIFSNTYKEMFEKRSITEPSVLLRIADRITCDIKRGVLNLDFEETKTEILALFDSLYNQKIMQRFRNIDIRWGIRQFEYSEDIYKEINNKNKEYNERSEEYETSMFWNRLKESPENLDDLMQQHKDKELFAQYKHPEDIVDIIESLENGQLFELTKWMGSRVNEDPSCKNAIDNEYERAQEIVELLEEKHKDKYGVKAGHIKQIARILKNKSTAYDSAHKSE